MFRTLGLTRENETYMSIAPKKPTIQSLDVIQIQTPCQMDWGLMTGDEQTCHCDHCSKNVYNISEMSQSEAISLINEKEGDICLRLFQRPDGTVVTADCPPVKKYYSNPEKKRWFQFSMASLMVLATTVAGLCASTPWIGKKLQPYYTAWFGADSAIPICSGMMGEMAPLPPPPVAPTTGSNDTRRILGKIKLPSDQFMQPE